MLNDHPHAEVHWNSAIFELAELLTINHSHKNFTIVSQTVQELSLSREHTLPNRDTTENIPDSLRYGCIGSKINISKTQCPPIIRYGGHNKLFHSFLKILKLEFLDVQSPPTNYSALECSHFYCASAY